MDWNALLRMKADFIPQLEDEEDTSYFDMRLDRYNHEVAEAAELDETRSSAEDTDDTTGTQSLFPSFTSASPRYRRQHDSSSSLIEHRHSMSICESSSQSSDQSSESSNNNSSFKTSPELRLRPKSTSEVGTNKSTAHLSCPDLETMVTKNANR